MKIKKNDTVQVIRGKDRGKKGKVIRIFPKQNKIIVDGVNLLIRHTRPRRQGEKGQRVQFAAPLDVSRVMLVCSRCGKRTRIGYKILESTPGKKNKVRICKKCKSII